MPLDADSVAQIYRWGVGFVLVAAAFTLPALLMMTAPYGRYTREGYGAPLPARPAWVVMELPAPLVFALVYFQGPHAGDAVPLVFLGLWQLHYLQRTFVFPLLMRSGGRGTPVTTFAMALVFNVVNGTLNALAVSHVAAYDAGWLLDPRFLAGAALFLAGWGINLHADSVLRNLRAPGETGYKIPRGGIYRWVSGGNYFGEIVEWCGWALATWSTAGLAFAVFTMANIGPRAIAHHRWYKERFPDYPPERKALIPGLL